MSYGGFRRRTGGGERNGDTTVMRVESANVGKIIGKQGSKIKQLEHDSNARIKISRDEDDYGKKEVEICGTQEEIECAKGLIEECISQGSDYFGGGGRRGGGYGGRDRSWGYDQEEGRRSWSSRDADVGWSSSSYGGDRGGGRRRYGSDESTETIYVEKSEVGRIIGRGGNRIREMEGKTGCKIKVLKEEDGHGRKPVELCGSKKQIVDAKEQIQRAMEPDDRVRGL